MNIEKLIKVSIIFLLGFLSANIAGLFLIYGSEIPFSFTNFSFSSGNNSAPFDFVKENQIQIYDDKIIINVENASISRYAATGSMLPVLDEGSNGIRIVPKSEADIHIGDIITFKQDNMLIVHRVVNIGTDSEGTYFTTKGDNNSINDGKIRFKDIKFITIGIIW
ncbi:MAG: signal peptidase I [Candidatus Nanoarchaeia archaeon]|nr:signal peptidase I [Candidatus Nanoarchaeia archaeon]MDD5741276.1 signal peptidase I [Candidatus Nanoarchaeia archaeon]